MSNLKICQTAGQVVDKILNLRKENFMLKRKEIMWGCKWNCNLCVKLHGRKKKERQPSVYANTYNSAS